MCEVSPGDLVAYSVYHILWCLDLKACDGGHPARTSFR